MCPFGQIALCCFAAFTGTVMAHACLCVLAWAVTQAADARRAER